MGSVNVAGNPVVNKYQTSNQAMVKHSRRIKSMQSGPLSQAEHGDTTTVEQVDPVTRAIGSGSLVRQGGSVEYFEEIVVGMTLPGRVVNARIASGDGATRGLSVDLADNKTQEVIEASLQPHIPQEGVKHTGNKVLVSNSVGDTTVRKDN